MFSNCYEAIPPRHFQFRLATSYSSYNSPKGLYHLQSTPIAKRRTTPKGSIPTKGIPLPSPPCGMHRPVTRTILALLLLRREYGNSLIVEESKIIPSLERGRPTSVSTFHLPVPFTAAPRSRTEPSFAGPSLPTNANYANYPTIRIGADVLSHFHTLTSGSLTRPLEYPVSKDAVALSWNSPPMQKAPRMGSINSSTLLFIFWFFLF